jgi:hypothetical protein
MTNNTYAVNLWGSHPDDDNDDCWTGDDFPTLAEAEAVFADPAPSFPFCKMADVAYVELDGPGCHKVRRNPSFVPTPDEGDEDWRREIAREEGMLNGIDSYNDWMGY